MRTLSSVSKVDENGAGAGELGRGNEDGRQKEEFQRDEAGLRLGEFVETATPWFTAAILLAILGAFTGIGYLAFRLAVSGSQRARRAKRIFKSWVLSSLIFSGFALAVSALTGVAGKLAIPMAGVVLFPALVLGVLHLGWFFFGSGE